MKRWVLAGMVVCGFAGACAAADMPVLGPYQPVPVRPLYSWTGCYIGVNMGGGASPQNRVDSAGVFGPPGIGLGEMTARGVAGGGQLGCDYQAGAWVFGLQGLLDLSGMKGSDVLPLPLLFNNSFVQTFGTVTGRVGYTLLPTLLVYGKGGVARVHDLYNISTSPGSTTPFTPGTFTIPAILTGAALLPSGTIIALGSKSSTGWTAGFGGEWAFAHAPVSLFLEYNYLSFRAADVPFLTTITGAQVFPINISQKVHTVLFGINLRFGGGADY